MDCSNSKCPNLYDTDYYIPNYGYICRQCHEDIDWSKEKLCCRWANRNIERISCLEANNIETIRYYMRVFSNAMDQLDGDYINYCPMCGTKLAGLHN